MSTIYQQIVFDTSRDPFRDRRRRFVEGLGDDVDQRRLPGFERLFQDRFEIGRILLGKLGDPAGAEARWNAACQSPTTGASC